MALTRAIHSAEGDMLRKEIVVEGYCTDDSELHHRIDNKRVLVIGDAGSMGSPSVLSRSYASKRTSLRH
ncbi:MAG: hypothetical protein WCJ02_00615 [bacterium]